MKKLIVMASLLLGAMFTANAQDNTEKSFGFGEGDVFVEGSLGFYSTNDKNTEMKTSGLEFSPKVGYFLSPKLAIGAELMIGSDKEEVAGTDMVKNSSFGAGVFARYYFLDLGARFKTYAEAGAAFGSQKESITGIKANGFGLGAGLGLQYFVTEKIAINFGLSDILSYTSAKVDGGKAESEFEGNVNVFNNFFTTTQFGLTFKI